MKRRKASCGVIRTAGYQDLSELEIRDWLPGINSWVNSGVDFRIFLVKNLLDFLDIGC